MAKLTGIFANTDQDGRVIPEILAQYAFVCRNLVDFTLTPEYILSVQPSGSFMIQKHFVNALGNEDMLFYKEEYVTQRSPRTVFEEEAETLTYGDFWEVFKNE
jgi:hypothetical protein